MSVGGDYLREQYNTVTTFNQLLDEVANAIDLQSDSSGSDARKHPHQAEEPHKR